MLKKWNVTEYINLYRTMNILNKKNKKTLGLSIPIDIYVQDPYVAKLNQAAALEEILIDREPDLMDGPTSARITVVDYNADTNKLEDPAHWNNREGRFEVKRGGKYIPIHRYHKNTPQFHQLNVWAIIQSVLNMYEETWVLGRSAPWAFEGNRLTVVPHAGYLPNAFYDRRSKSLQFYYFGAGEDRVYTCLSHDIIAHETGHAILDGLRPFYIEDSSLQTTAFHEFVADMTAILSSLLNNELRLQMAEETGGDLSAQSLVTAIAEEFGEYATGRPHLRSALVKDTIDDVRDSENPYDWAQVLTASMWEILTKMVERRKEILTDRGDSRSVKQILWWAAKRFRRVAFQALDYLPPVDVQFSDYARAVFLADKAAYASDDFGYRARMEEVFKARGIEFGEGFDETRRLNFYTYNIDRISRSRTDAYHFIHENRRQLCIPPAQDISIVDLYQTDKTLPGGGKLPREIVLQYIWREDLLLKGSEFGPLDGKLAAMLCGGTLVFDGRGNVLSWIRKPGTGRQESDGRRRRDHCNNEQQRGLQRRAELLKYISSRIARGYVGLFDGGRPEEIEAHTPVVAEPRGDGTLRLEVTPHLRHWVEE